MKRLVSLALVSGMTWLVAALIAATPIHAQMVPQRPDVILIVTDDQSLNTMAYMPFTRNFFRTNYSRAYISNPLCCPSRTSILTGTYSYTNHVWTNEPPYGGWPQFSANGWETRSIPALLQQNGYRTGMFGKFLNKWDDRIPLGWDVMAAQAHRGVRGPGKPYYNYSLRHADGSYEDHLDAPGDYSTDRITQLAVHFIRRASPSQPQFLYFTPGAPHPAGGSLPPIPAPRHLDSPVLPEPSVSPNFLEADVRDKPKYVRAAQGGAEPAGFYRNWLMQAARSLFAVDEGIEAIVDAQRARDPGLHDTLFLFISDNGLLAGSHNLLRKGVPYEEAIRVPMMARYDGIAAGTVRDIVMNVDVAPTIVEATGIRSAPWTIEGESLFAPTHRQWALIEGALPGQSFCGIANPNRKIVRYASGEWEFYNLRNDPYELVNRPGARLAVTLKATATAACEGKLPPLWPRPSL